MWLKVLNVSLHFELLVIELDESLLKMQVAIFLWLLGIPLAAYVLDRFHMAVLIALPLALWCMTAPLLVIGEVAIAIGYVYLLIKRRLLKARDVYGASPS